MSFLDSAGAGAAGAAGSTGLGQALGLNPNDVKAFGTAMNGIAKAGGAGGEDSGPPPLHNIMQLIDPNILRSIYAQIHGGGTQSGYAQ